MCRDLRQDIWDSLYLVLHLPRACRHAKMGLSTSIIRIRVADPGGVDPNFNV